MKIIKTVLTMVALLITLTGCASQSLAPQKPVSVTVNGHPLIISFYSSAVSGSFHLKINNEIVASGSFGAFFGETAEGAGNYKGFEVMFHAKDRKRPVCTVYINGKEIAELKANGTSHVTAI
ncbi:MAG: hypothetical protein K9M45_04020 [Kiritimatiellales bacterium]|nr:hypothetical protein [Kiritimatiellales bacterium]